MPDEPRHLIPSSGAWQSNGDRWVAEQDSGSAISGGQPKMGGRVQRHALRKGGARWEIGDVNAHLRPSSNEPTPANSASGKSGPFAPMRLSTVRSRPGVPVIFGWLLSAGAARAAAPVRVTNRPCSRMYRTGRVHCLRADAARAGTCPTPSASRRRGRTSSSDQSSAVGFWSGSSWRASNRSKQP
jgi:hypothetical protein